MTNLIKDQILRAGLVKQLDKIAQGSESKQEVWQEGLKRLVPPEEKENTAPPPTSSNKKDDAEDNTAEQIAISSIPDEFTMVMFRRLVTKHPKLNNFLGAFMALMAAGAEKQELVERYGVEIAEKKIAEIIERGGSKKRNVVEGLKPITMEVDITALIESGLTIE